MFLIIFIFLAAFTIEGLATYVSVVGLSTLFGANLVIIALAIALDMGKLAVVTLLYTHWEKLGKMMRTYAFIAAAITMTITSAGAGGYLSSEFQRAILGTQEVGLKVGVLKAEQAKLEDRKKQIDAGIAAIPDRYSANQKIRLMAQFKDEQKQVTARLNELSKQLPDVQLAQIGVEAKAGPILYIAKAFDIPVESAVKWVILMIIIVFDPLAVFLIIAGNFLVSMRKSAQAVKTEGWGPLKLAEKQVTIEDDLDAASSAPIGSPEWETAMEQPKLPSTMVSPFMEKPIRIYKGEDLGPPLEYEEPDFGPYISAEKTPSPLYEIQEPTPSYKDDADDTEILVETPPHSDVLPFYLAAQASAPPKPSAGYEEPNAITLSTLGLVKSDPSTITDVAANPTANDWEVGTGTGVFKTGAPKR